MRIKYFSSCLVLVLALFFIFPANAIAASGEEVVSLEDLSNAGINSGDSFTIYYGDDGEILKIVKGSPENTTYISQLVEIPSIANSKGVASCQVASPIQSGYNDRGAYSYTTSQIIYHGYVSSGCQFALGAYNVPGNYFTGYYFGPYDSTTGINYNWSGSQSEWKYQVCNWGPSTLINTLFADIYYI